MAEPPCNLSEGTLWLRPIDLIEDVQPWYEGTRNPEMYLWTGNETPASRSHAYAVLKTYASHPDIWAWSVVDLRLEALIGVWWMGIPHVKDGRTVSFDAQRIFQPYWRTGRTEAARRILYDFAFGELKIDEMHAAAWASNQNSCRSMEAAGFQLVDQRQRYNEKYGMAMDEREYVLTRQQWMAGNGHG